MFRFSLQDVLEHRQLVEDNKKAEFAYISALIREREAALATIRHDRTDYFKQLSTIESTHSNMAVRTLYEWYFSYLDAETKRLKKEIVELNAQKEQKRGDLIKAMKDRRVLEEVQKKEQEEYQKQERKKEAKTYDDIALGKYVRAQSEKIA